MVNGDDDDPTICVAFSIDNKLAAATLHPGNNFVLFHSQAF